MNDAWGAMSDANRRRILTLLKDRDMTAGEIADCFELSKATVSHHLSILKDYRKFVLVLIAVAVLNLIAMLCVIPGMPEEIPGHFNYRFEVDAMGSPWMMIIFPAITLVFTIAMAVEQKIRGRDYANNKVLTIFATFFVGFFIALGWMLYALGNSGAQLGDIVEFPISLIMGLGFSVLFIVMGNYLPTVQPNRTFGIRLPATFRSEEVWRKAHRFGGKMFVLGGLFAAAMSLIGYFAGIDWLAFAGLMGGIFIPMIIILFYVRNISAK